jgi:hypothetical protein
VVIHDPRFAEPRVLARAMLSYVAATQAAIPTGFWDRAPQPTAGRLRRVLERVDFSPEFPLLEKLRKKQSVTEH